MSKAYTLKQLEKQIRLLKTQTAYKDQLLVALSKELNEKASDFGEFKNNRIQELAEQAGIELGYDGYNAWYNKRFAELIIAECLDIITAQSTLEENADFRDGFSHGRKYAWLEIRKHFGITE